MSTQLVEITEAGHPFPRYAVTVSPELWHALSLFEASLGGFEALGRAELWSEGRRRAVAAILFGERVVDDEGAYRLEIDDEARDYLVKMSGWHDEALGAAIVEERGKAEREGPTSAAVELHRRLVQLRRQLADMREALEVRGTARIAGRDAVVRRRFGREVDGLEYEVSHRCGAAHLSARGGTLAGAAARLGTAPALVEHACTGRVR